MIRIDECPTHELNGIKYRCGRVQPFGASIVGNSGINFSVFSKDATYCELVLFHHGQKKPFANFLPQKIMNSEFQMLRRAILFPAY